MVVAAASPVPSDPVVSCTSEEWSSAGGVAPGPFRAPVASPSPALSSSGVPSPAGASPGSARARSNMLVVELRNA